MSLSRQATSGERTGRAGPLLGEGLGKVKNREGVLVSCREGSCDRAEVPGDGLCTWPEAHGGFSAKE